MNHQVAKDAKDAKDANRREPRPERDALARVVVDASLEVHRVLGPGYLEGVYEEALAVELRLRSVMFRRQVRIAVQYKGCHVGKAFLDFLVGESLVVELKAVEQLAPVHVGQVISYLKATGNCLGLLITFNVQQLRSGIRRVVLTPPSSSVGDLGALAVQSSAARGHSSRASDRDDVRPPDARWPEHWR